MTAMNPIASDLNRREEAVRNELARRDPNVFVEMVLGLRQAAIHRELQAFLSGHDEAHIELHRGIGKTTQYAARCAWEIGLDPDIRIKNVQQNDNEAAKTGAMIQAIIESERYRKVFPRVTPDPDHWSKGSFRVKRLAIMRDATYEARGIFGRAGGRWDLLIGDDVCDLRNSIQQNALRAQVKEAWSNTWAPMRDETSGKRTRRWTIATPWHVHDITADWRKYHSARGSLMRRPCVDCVSPWPEAWSQDRLEAFRDEHGSVAYARAFELQPLSDEDHPIKAEWIRWYAREEITPLAMRRFLGVDLAISKASRAAYTVFVDLAVDMAGCMYVVRVLRRRMDFPSAVKAFLDWDSEVRYERAGIETVAYQEAFAAAVEGKARVPIERFAGVAGKYERAATLAIPIEQGRFYLLGSGGIPDPSQAALFDELTLFPVHEFRDCLDACGYAVAVAQKGVRTSEYVSVHEDEDDYPGRRGADEWQDDDPF